jgi:hypothetical protein
VTEVPPVNDWLHPVEPPLQLMPAGLEVTLPEPPTVTCSVSIGTTGANVAPTVWAAFSVIEQLAALPEQAPVQPDKAFPGEAVAVSVTTVPALNDWLQPVDPPLQLIPAGLELTVPAPPTVTCSVSVCTTFANEAPTGLVAVLSVTTHVGWVPEQAPVQPENAKPDAAVAVSVTTVPLTYDWLHPAAPPLQLMPAGLEVTVPEPPTVTASESVWTMGAKDAPTVVAALSVIVQVPALPEQLPVHPDKVFPEDAVAVRVTVVPALKDWLHPVAPPLQLIPAGAEVTVPAPPTVTCRVSVWTMRENEAPAASVAWLSFTTHVGSEPEHAPVQPENAKPDAAAAVSVTDVPSANDWLHPVAPPLQLMPAGLELTVPEPPTVNVSESVWTMAAKDAPALCAALSVRVQVAALPEQAPVHPTNREPEAGAAVSVTVVPLSNVWLQLPVAPEQLIPAGLDVTVPAPPTVTCSDSSWMVGANCAPTFSVALTVSVQL